MSGTSFGTFWDFLTIFEQFSFFHWKSMIFWKNSKNPYFDLWDLLWWVFHMVLALNHWFRPKNEGSKKSVPQNCKSAGSDALKKDTLKSYEYIAKGSLQSTIFSNGELLISFKSLSFGEWQLIFDFFSTSWSFVWLTAKIVTHMATMNGKYLLLFIYESCVIYLKTWNIVVVSFQWLLDLGMVTWPKNALFRIV